MKLPVKTKVLFILPDLHSGGAERVVTTIINHLDRDLFYPILVLMRKEGFYLDILRPDVPVIELKVRRIRHSLIPLLKTIKRIKPHIVFSAFGEVNAYLSPFIKMFPKTKFIARETNVVSEHVTRRSILFFYRFYRNYHKIVAQSEDMRQDLIQNFNIPEHKIALIHNPVDIAFIQSQAEISPIDEEYFLTSTNPKVITIGNLSYRKGIDLLLQVFKYLKQTEIELFIIGDGPQKEEFMQLRKDLGLDNVYFLGRKKNPYCYLAKAQLYVLSSRYEGFPNVLLEAGALGIYALANTCKGGINEIIIPKVNGEVHSIEDAVGFAERIKELVSINHNTEQIQAITIERFAKEKILEKYHRLLASLV